MATISKRGKNFRIKVSLGYDTNRKQIIKSTTFSPPDGISPKKAEKLANAYAVEFENRCKGYTQLNENMRFSELAAWYFEYYAPVKLKKSTTYTYKGQYKKHIEPYLGNYKLKDITTPQLTQFVNSHNLNPQTLRKVYVIVQSIFRRGVEQGFIKDSPCHNVVLPKIKKKQKNILDENAVCRFIKLLETKTWSKDFKRIIKVLLYTGMRIGECLGLSWADIDFNEMTITIRHNLVNFNGKFELSTPKTENSNRVIVMSETLAEILKEQKKYIEELYSARKNNFPHPEMVFTSTSGNYRDRNSVYKSLKSFTKGTEFEQLTLHQLRHCNATLLLNSGIDLKIVSEHLGHSDIRVTANVYADVLKSSKIKTANLIALKLDNFKDESE